MVPTGGEILLSPPLTTDPTLLGKEVAARAYREAALTRLGAARIDRQNHPIPHELDPDPDAARSLIDLPRISEATLLVGQLVARQRVYTVHFGSAPFCDRLREAAQAGGGLTTAEFEQAITIALRILESPLWGPEMAAVVAAICLLPNQIPSGQEKEVGFLRNLPSDFLDSGAADECFVRLQTVLRYFIVHERGLSNARRVEESGVITETRVFPAGLRNTTIRDLSSLELLEIAEPAVTFRI
jgi:hypothetical protein